MRLPAFLCILLLSAIPAAHAADRYSARFDANLEGVEVTACFEGRPPQRLYRHSDSARYTSWIKSGGKPVNLRAEQRSVRLPSLTPGSCLARRVELRRAAQSQDHRIGFVIAGDLLVETSLWFWKGSRERDILVDVRVPDGVSVSVPWPEADTGRPGSGPALQPESLDGHVRVA